MPTKKKMIRVPVDSSMEAAIKAAARELGQSAADYIRDLVAADLEIKNQIEAGGWRGTPAQREQYDSWLAAQTAGDDGYDPLMDEDGDYSFQSWYENVYKGDDDAI